MLEFWPRHSEGPQQELPEQKCCPLEGFVGTAEVAALDPEHTKFSSSGLCLV